MQVSSQYEASRGSSSAGMQVSPYSPWRTFSSPSDTGMPAQPLFGSEHPNTYLDLGRGSFTSSSFVSSHFQFFFVLDVSVLPASVPSAESGSCASPLIFLPRLLVSCGLSL